MAQKTRKEISKALPDLKSEKVDVYADELDRILVLKRIFQSEDGKVLVTELRESCLVAIRKLLIAYKNNPDLPTILGICASLDSNYTLLSKIQDISTEKEIREQLDLAVKEAYEG